MNGLDSPIFGRRISDPAETFNCERFDIVDKPKMTTMMIVQTYMFTFTMAMVVTVLSMRPCEQTADVVKFPYACLDNKLVTPCFQGRHLRIAQPECVGEVDEANICVKCINGFINGSNFCNECNPWTECGPDEREDPENPPSAIKDRTCIPNSAPTESTSHSPPSDAASPTCPPPPECPTLGMLDALSTVDGSQGHHGTSYIPDSDISTAPQGGASTIGPLPRKKVDDDVNWKYVAIVFIILTPIQFIIWCVVVWRCCQRKQRCDQGAVRYIAQNGNKPGSHEEEIPDVVCLQEPQNNPDCEAAQPGIGSGQNCASTVNLPPEHSEGATASSQGAASNTATNATPAQSTGQSSEGANNIPLADEDSFEDQNAPLHSHQGARGSNDAAGSNGESASPPRAPLAREDYSVEGDAPSLQPLLDGNDTRDCNTSAES